MKQAKNSSVIGRFASTVSICALLAIGASLPGSAGAQNITILNNSFEDPSLRQGDFTAEGINGWTNAAVATGVWNPGPSGTFFTTSVPDGSQIGFINNSGTISQQLAATLQPGTYNLSAFFGNRLDGSTGDTLELWAGGTAINGIVLGGTELASNQIAITDIASGFFAPLSVSYVASGNDPLLGELLSIRLGHINNLDNGQSDFDDVKLTSSAVPEAGTMVDLGSLLGLGVLGLLRARRRK